MRIRRAHMDDAPCIWSIIGPTIRAGETYPLDRDMTEANALAYWLGEDRETFVAEESGEILGTYYIRPNQAGGGNHICNCGYMTHTAAAGRGVARGMCEHSLEHARAVRLWQSLGFEIVGRLPAAFRHPIHGYVDALVMYRLL